MRPLLSAASRAVQVRFSDQTRQPHCAATRDSATIIFSQRCPVLRLTRARPRASTGARVQRYSHAANRARSEPEKLVDFGEAVEAKEMVDVVIVLNACLIFSKNRRDPSGYWNGLSRATGTAVCLPHRRSMATGSVRGSYFDALSTTEEPSAPIADADCASCPGGHGIRAPMTGRRVSADSSASRDLFSVHLCFMVCGLNVKHDLGSLLSPPSGTPGRRPPG